MTAEVTAVPAGRFGAFDRLKGLIMVIMALDHVSFMVGRLHANESWALPKEPATFTRTITHLCAPGFMMLLGAGMVWFGKARQRVGWSHADIRNFFVKRGLVLLVVQHLIENPAWVIAIVTMNPSLPLATAPSPGGGTPFFLHFAVLTALGASMIFWALLIELPSVIVAAVSVAAVALSVWMTPPASEIATLFPAWKLLLFVPSHTNAVDVLYPVVPWLAPAGVGIILGRIVYKKPLKTAAIGFAAGVALFASHFALAHLGFAEFLKYPPTPMFLTITLAVDLLLLGVFAVNPFQAVVGWLEVFGRSPLFFYILHLYVFALVGVFFRNGAGYPVIYAVWVAGVIAMYPVVAAYGRFKASKPVESLWRLF